MRGLLLGTIGVLALCGAGCGSLQQAPGLVKVLPHFLDQYGRHTTGVTLTERDVYQLELRKDPAAIHGVRYNVNWIGQGETTVRLELRSTKAGVEPLVLEQTVTPNTRRTWTQFLIDRATYQNFGQPESWRVTLWQADEQIAEQTSFLW